MKILVVGGGGFIGSHLVDRLVDEGYDVMILDNFSGTNYKKPAYLNPKAEFVLGDVRDLSVTRKLVSKSDVIFHTAASVGIAQSNYEIIRFVDNNCTGTATLLQTIIDSKRKIKLIISSSNTIYGEGMYVCSSHGKFHPGVRTHMQINKYGFEPVCPICESPGKPIPTPESTSLDCNSVYALTKKFQEEKALLIGKMYGFPVIVLRYFNVFGPRQSLSNPYTGVSAIFISRIKAGNIPIIYEDGNQTRDFISVHDVVEANMLVLDGNEDIWYHVFNIGSGKPISIKNLATEICKLYDKEVKYEITWKFRAGDIRHCIADNSKAAQMLGWYPKIHFKKQLEEIYEWAQTEAPIDEFDKANNELKEKGLLL